MAISFPRISLPGSAPRPRHDTRSGGARVASTAVPCPNGAGAPMKESLPLLPTSVVGSHGLPGCLWLAREALEARRLGAIDVKEVMEDATQLALLDQERAGVDVLSTGEMGRGRVIG